VVTCPLHNWNISLRSGNALGADEGCVPTIPLKVDAGRIYLKRSAVLSPRAVAARTVEARSVEAQAA